METLQEYAPVLLPLIAMQLVLAIVSIVHIVKHPQVRGNKIVWMLVVLLIQFFGPLAYFLFGRGEE